MPEKRDTNPDFINQKEMDLYSTARPSPKPESHPLKGNAFKVRAPIKDAPLKEKVKVRSRGSFARKFFAISLIVLLAASLYAAYRLFFSESREDYIARHIKVSMESVPFTRGGEPLTMTFTATNKNKITLKNVKTEIEYPRGSTAESRDDFERVFIDLGDIPAGASASKDITFVLYGEQASSKTIRSTLEYGLPGSSLTYTKVTETAITISSAPVVLEIDAPRDIAPGQLYTLRLRASQNTKSLPPGTLLTVAYPRDFEVETVSRPPTYNVGTWRLGMEKEGDFEDLTITGRFNSQEGDERSFRFLVGIPGTSDQASIKTSYVSKTHVVTLARPVLEASILLGTEKGKVIAAAPDSYIQGTLIYRNRGTTAVVDPVFRIRIEGSALDETSILPLEGFYDSNKKEIFWDKNTMPSLSSIAPGREGRLTFTFRVLPKTIDGPAVVKDPLVNLFLSFSGVRDDGLNVVQTLENIEVASVRVTTEPAIEVSNIFASGSLPPKVGTETVYQVSFTVKNTHNDITAAKLVAKLPFYVKWVGKVTREEKVAYNPDTREVIWTLGDVASGAGNTTAARTMAIQVSITPSLSQLDSAPELIQNIRFTGTDLFSNKDVRASRSNVTTRITNGTSQDAIVIR